MSADATVPCCVDDMSSNINENVGDLLKTCSFALQIDDTTDVSGKCYLIICLLCLCR